ncbi:mechanosensitive ion channel domain-containing protein, partial [Klebsiella pneumoniae]|uniref:mechanosensitive ion channel domain-containing protein n=1 Tax=Klebsiella pneumoniae TaxID=573 RepID=UPI003851D514
VGDWVVVGSTEGIIKHINVRSTEIETFDLASVIIPNAELLSHALTNWTHKDRRGRVEIKISVHPDSDPDIVSAML